MAILGEERPEWSHSIHEQYRQIHENALRTTVITKSDLYTALMCNYRRSKTDSNANRNVQRMYEASYQQLFVIGLIGTLCMAIGVPLAKQLYAQMMGVRCFVPNNYLIWEATRPIADCTFCRGVSRPRILSNVTKAEFSPYAYSSEPIIIKGAVAHWPAAKQLNFQYLKRLYEQHADALDQFADECQFLHFKSTFRSLRDFFAMPSERAQTGRPAWYVGFSNCQSLILQQLRQLYPRPHFLPDDAEIPNTDYVFMGYDQGAVTHLDYIPRLMWQAQLRGNKTWMLSPAPECDRQCNSFSFYVEPGDAVLIDTRVWYHGTTISKGQFSLTIQSEYG